LHVGVTDETGEVRGKGEKRGEKSDTTVADARKKEDGTFKVKRINAQEGGYGRVQCRSLRKEKKTTRMSLWRRIKPQKGRGFQATIRIEGVVATGERKKGGRGEPNSKSVPGEGRGCPHVIQECGSSNGSSWSEFKEKINLHW